jgi:hypothetical protein
VDAGRLKTPHLFQAREAVEAGQTARVVTFLHELFKHLMTVVMVVMVVMIMMVVMME